MVRPLILLLSLCTLLPAAELIPGPQAPEHSLVRVKLSEGERATVLGKDFASVDQTPTPYGIAFTGPASRYAVLVITDGGIETLVVEIIGSGPAPVPPKPDDDDPQPPEPKPDDPIPDDVPNRMGIGHSVYREAAKIGDPKMALQLGNNAVNVANRLHKGQLLYSEGLDEWKASAERLGNRWKELADFADARMTEAVFGNAGGQLAWRDAFWEVGIALQKLGGKP